MPAKSMYFHVAGTGYTGRRVLLGLPREWASGISRSRAGSEENKVRAIDLDEPSTEPIIFEHPYVLLYTIPPGRDSEGDERLAAFLRRIEPTPRRIVYLSTSGVYGNRHGALTSETDSINPSTNRARRRVAAEQLLTRWCERKRCELIILRVSAIYGPSRLGVERLQKGAEILCEADSGPGNRIHVDDLSSCCVTAMTGDAPAGIYNVSDGDTRSGNWFARTVAGFAKLSAPPEISIRQAELDWSEERLSFAKESRRLDNQKMRAVLGVNLRYSNAEEGIRASLADEAIQSRK